jgi:hypothetical protein
MKVIINISVLVVLFFCSCSDKRIVRKNIANKDIDISWYFYSYISNTSAHFIEIKNKKTNSIVLVAKAEQAIIDVELKNDTILISHTKFHDYNTEIRTDKNVFNYIIVFKELTSHEVYLQSLKEKKE